MQALAAQQVLRGHVPSITRRLAPVRRLDGGARLDLAIGLPLRNREALTNLLQELYQPASANFRRYLTPDQFAARFGPSEADYQKVIEFAKAHGLTVKRSHPNRTLLDVAGSVADIEKAFHIHLLVYKHPVEARDFFAPDVEPSLDLDTPVLAISGLDSYKIPRPRIRPLGATLRPAVRPLGGGGSGGGGGGGGGSGAGGSYYGYDFLGAYASDVSLDGAGQSVGLFELTGYASSDIDDYVAETSLPGVPLQNILIDGFDGNDNNLDYAVECTVDIEMAISMAPYLDSVLVYEGPTPTEVPPVGTNFIQYASTTAQINDVLNRMATDDLAKQLSCSYGMDINLSTVQIFQQYAAQGQSFFLASGDFGAYVGAADEPEDDPYITVVGGTTLSTTGPGGTWVSETVWNTPAANDPLVGYTPQMASGGGVSRTYGVPAWQQGISMMANQGSTTMRNSPDVAMVADNIDIVFGNDAIGLSFDFTEAGTSLAAPLWAGFMALVNQQAAANGQPSVGFANPALYAIGKSVSYQSCLHDITSGNNETTNSPTKYTAAAGYDLCTGWGSPTGSNLVQALLAPPSETLVVTPPLGFTSFGRGGGPYSVGSQIYTLKNIGSGSLNWTMVNTSSWLSVSASSGTLGPGSSTTVTISLNSAATGFLIGNYSGNVSILNTSAGTVQNRQFDLYVGNGGFETGDLTDWILDGSTDLVFALAGDDADVAGMAALPGQPDELFVRSGLYGAYLGEFAWNGYPAMGSLSQTVATAAHQQYLVSFWLTCVPDSQGITTNNAFIAKWNNSVLYAKSNLGAFGWTNLQFVAPVTTTSTTLEFDFNNDPGAFGLDDVGVEPVPAPVIQSVVCAGGTVKLTWSSVAGLSYQVQSASSLSNPSWTNVATVTATGNVATASETVGSAPQQLYRVILLLAP